MVFKKGNVPWIKGRTKETDEQVQAMAESKKGKSSWIKGLHHSEETKEKIRQKHLGTHVSDKIKQKMSIISIRIWKSHPERRKMYSEMMKSNHYVLGKHWQLSDKTKEKIRQANLGKHFSPEYKEKIRQSVIRAMINSELREKISKQMMGNQNAQGHLVSEEAREKIRQQHLGRLLLETTKEKIRQKCLGENNVSYIDGRSKLGNGYRGDDWNLIRRQVLERDEYKCDSSNTGECKGRLMVHHLDPYFESRNNSLGNLITLCRRHHGIVERSNEELPRSWDRFTS